MHPFSSAFMIGFLMLACIASAQPHVPQAPATPADFSGLRLRIGDIVYVRDTQQNVEVRGPLRSLSPHEVLIDGYRFAPTAGLEIEREGDAIWNGAAIGFLLGGVAGVTVGAEGCLDRAKIYCFVGGGLTYGAIGAFIDWRHKGRTRVFPAPDRRATLRVTPDVRAHRKGAVLAVRF
jgi:hypothetical protein